MAHSPSSLRSLTPRQEEALVIVRKYIQENRISPTYREVMLLMGLTSLATAAFHLKTLEQKGYITRRHHVSMSRKGGKQSRCAPRSIVLTDKDAANPTLEEVY